MKRLMENEQEEISAMQNKQINRLRIELAKSAEETRGRRRFLK